MLRILCLICVSLTLLGCSEFERQAQEREQNILLKEKPEVQSVGQFDGCDVKYVNRGEHIDSFFIAKCDAPSVTVTNSYVAQYGKSYVDEHTMSVNQSKNERFKERVLSEYQVRRESLRSEEQKLKDQYKKTQDALKDLDQLEKHYLDSIK